MRFQEFLGGFVGRVLGDEATLESPLQDALSQSGGTLQVGVYLGFDSVDDRESVIEGLHDLFNLVEWWQRNRNCLDLRSCSKISFPY